MNQRKKIIIMLIIGIPIVGLILTKLVLLTLAYWLGTAMCDSSVYQTVSSPTQEYSAKLVEVDCGATTTWTTQVKLESLHIWEPGQETIVSLRGRPSENSIQLRWVGNHTLSIQLPINAKLYTRKNQWRDIQILYLFPQ
jgi:hypothetical protein